MINKIEQKKDKSSKVKRRFVAQVQNWLGVKVEEREKANNRLTEITKQLDLARFRISQYQNALSAIGRSKQEYEYLYEAALKAMNVAWQNYGSLRPQWEAEIDTFESTVTSLLAIQNELEQYNDAHTLSSILSPPNTLC